MMDVRTIFPAFLFLLIFLSCDSNPAELQEENPLESTFKLKNPGLNVGILIINGVYNTELTAPYDIFHHTEFREDIDAMNVFTICGTLEPIKTFEGIEIQADYSYFESYPEIDILVVPSAVHSMDTDMGDEPMIDFVRKTAKTAQYVTSHCDGAFILAAAGLLDGVHCTTYPADRAELSERFSKTFVHDSVLFVHDGNIITSAGGAKSFEASLYLIELLYGKENADEIAEGMVIDWDLDKIPHLIIEK
jgi:transcriptional regulator GlxA family with amidase domain